MPNLQNSKPGYHKVYTEVRYDAAGRILYEDYYWERDDAPVELCGPSAEVKNRELDLTQRQTSLAEDQQTRANALQDKVTPGLDIAENYYQALASGDHQKIMAAVSPAIEGINKQYAAAKQTITDTMPRGGESRLAKENIEINRGAQTGNAVTQGYSSSFPALAALAGQGTGLSINQMANAISSYSGAATTINNVGSQEAAGKAATMGLLGSMAGAAGTAFEGAGCWIAEAIYGRYNFKTLLLRIWMNRVWAKTRVGSIVMRLYLKYGKRVAVHVRAHRTVRWMLKPLFDCGLAAARRHYRMVKL
jgi:hypothetical protein